MPQYSIALPQTLAEFQTLVQHFLPILTAVNDPVFAPIRIFEWIDTIGLLIWFFQSGIHTHKHIFPTPEPKSF
jgi:hypothetical protein